MTALFSTRRRADNFAAAVDAAAGAGSAANKHVDLDEELRALVAVVGALRGPELHTGGAVPRAEFSADLRTRLMAEAEQVLSADTAQLRLPARPRGRRERRLVAAATAVVLLGGSAGMAAAAQQALPGEALYPIKRGLEQAETGLSMSDAGKGRDLLHHASDRLSEVRALLVSDSATAAPQVPATLEDFSAQAREGAELLMSAYRETRDPANIVAIRQFAADGLESIRELAPSAPDEAKDELADAALTLGEIDQAAIALCSTCAQDLPVLELPGFLLAAAEVDRTLARLDSGTLDNSHPVEVDRELVERADRIAGSQDGDADTGNDGSGDGPGAPDADSPDLQLPGGTDTGGGGGGDEDEGLLGELGNQLGDLGGDTDAETDKDSGSVTTDGSGGGLLEDTTDQLEDTTDDLTGTVATILPDPEGDLLP